MRHFWRNFEFFDEDPRERQQLSRDMGLCPLWDRACADRVQRTWTASQGKLGPSFLTEAHLTTTDVTEPFLKEEVAEYVRRRFCERAIELTRSS